MSELLEKFDFSYVLDIFFPFYAQERIAPVAICQTLFFKEQLEQFSHIALYKRASVSDLLRSRMTKERREGFALLSESLIALSLTKSEGIARKTYE